MDTRSLLQAVKAAQGITSDYRLARFLGVTDNTVGNWQHGRSRPDDATAVRLAELAGLDAAEVLASLYAERASTDELRSIWRRLAERAHAAALAALTVILSLWIGGGPDGAAMASTPVASNGGHLSITQFTSYTLARMLRRLFEGFSRPGPWPMVHPCCT